MLWLRSSVGPVHFDWFFKLLWLLLSGWVILCWPATGWLQCAWWKVTGGWYLRFHFLGLWQQLGHAFSLTPKPPVTRFLWHLIFDSGLDCGVRQTLLEHWQAKDHGSSQSPLILMVINPYYKVTIASKSRVFCKFVISNDTLHEFFFRNFSILTEVPTKGEGDIK